MSTVDYQSFTSTFTSMPQRFGTPSTTTAKGPVARFIGQRLGRVVVRSVLGPHVQTLETLAGRGCARLGCGFFARFCFATTQQGGQARRGSASNFAEGDDRTSPKSLRGRSCKSRNKVWWSSASRFPEVVSGKGPSTPSTANGILRTTIGDPVNHRYGTLAREDGHKTHDHELPGRRTNGRVGTVRRDVPFRRLSVVSLHAAGGRITSILKGPLCTVSAAIGSTSARGLYSSVGAYGRVDARRAPSLRVLHILHPTHRQEGRAGETPFPDRRGNGIDRGCRSNEVTLAPVIR